MEQGGDLWGEEEGDKREEQSAGVGMEQFPLLCA